MHIYRDLLPDTMLSQWNFIILMSDVGFLTSPGYLIGFLPDIIHTWCISILYGRIPHNTWTYVTFLLTGTFDWWIKNVFAPTGSSSHCYYCPNLLHIHFPHNILVLPLEISLYSIAFTVVSKVTLFFMGNSVTIFFFFVSITTSSPTLFVLFFFILFYYPIWLFRFVLRRLFTLSSGIGVALDFFGTSLCILGLHLRPIYSCFIFLPKSHLVPKFYPMWLYYSPSYLLWWRSWVKFLLGWTL